MAEETNPRRIRRMAKDYATRHYAQQGAKERNRIWFAWDRGYWAARNEFTERLRHLEACKTDADLLAAADILVDEYLGEAEA
ncbi:hypothetical protein [Microbacterium sp.]|uniref:hypothetical protein n=1 Tax=Microbacterium sp. TaxID=51671 RepID=UPI0039E63F88